MSLQVWLPLNGSITENIANKTFVNSNAVLSAPGVGKIGSYTYRFLGDAQLIHELSITDIEHINNASSYTIACWVKLYEGQNGWGQILTIGNQGTSWNDIRIGFDNQKDATVHFSVSDGTNNTSYQCCSNNNLQDNKWHHLVGTYDKGTLTMYVDGIEQNSKGTATFQPALSPTSYIIIGGNSTEKPICMLNDVRFYDHCLSPREVKLLAQGLVAHYKLDSGQPNLIKHGAEEKSGSGYCVAKYAFDKSGFGRYLNPGEQCSLTVCFTPHANFGYWFPHLNQGDIGGWIANPETTGKSDGTTKCQIVTMQSTTNWNYYNSASQVVSANDDRAEICMFAKNKDGSANNANVTIHWMKLQVGSHTNILTFSPSLSENATLYSNEYDCSGYGRHLAGIGSPCSDTISARYTSAINFNQSGYYKKDDFNFSTEQFTYAFWVKMPSSSNGQHFLFGSHDSWPNNGFSAWRDQNSNSYNTLIKSSNESSYTGISFTPDANQWTHITYTYSGTSLKYYKNGEFINAITYGGGGAVAHPVMYIGNSRYGGAPTSEIDESAMSDFRLYATALSAAAVKELYQSSISFLDNGTLQCSEIVESNTNLKYNQNGITQAKLISEIGYINEMKIKTLSDGSAWARIHWLDVTSIQTYFTEAEVQECTTASNRFSLMKYVEYFKGTNGYYEFMLTHPKLSTTAYNRWKQTSSPNSSSVSGFSTIGTQAWGAANHGIRKHNGSNCVYNCDEGGTWYAPIGQFAAWGGGIPAANQSNTATSEIELWVRIDNLPKLTKLSMFNKALQAHQIYEL